jgi:uncharacterized membrane protein YfcA
MPPDVAAGLTFAGLGLFVGFFSGLLGIGGGAMTVPILGLVFVASGFEPAHVMPMAIGSSLAAIVPATASGTRTHHHHGAVRWDLVRGLAPGIVLAGLAAGTVARVIPTTVLKGFFFAFVVYITWQIVFGMKPGGTRPVPGRAGLFGAGLLVGGFSGLAGVGGAMISMPFMMSWGIPFKTAIGTGSAISFVVAAAGVAGFIAAGWNLAGLPALTLGYVYLPAFLGISVTSVFAAPLGAKLAHRLPVATLRKLFAVFILLLAAKLIASL